MIVYSNTTTVKLSAKKKDKNVLAWISRSKEAKKKKKKKKKKVFFVFLK
jgi:hypothetical protein